MQVRASTHAALPCDIVNRPLMQLAGSGTDTCTRCRQPLWLEVDLPSPQRADDSPALLPDARGAPTMTVMHWNISNVTLYPASATQRMISVASCGVSRAFTSIALAAGCSRVSATRALHGSSRLRCRSCLAWSPNPFPCRAIAPLPAGSMRTSTTHKCSDRCQGMSPC